MTISEKRKLMTPELKQKVERRVREVLELGAAIWPDHTTKFSTLPTIRYDIKNTFGGVAISGGVDDWTIRLNLILCYENEELFIEQTVGHEVAHLIQRVVYGTTKVQPKTQKIVKIRSHGPEWQEVMVKIGLPPARTHSYDLASIDTRKKRSRKGTVLSAMDSVAMIVRLQNGFRRLPDSAKDAFIAWVGENK